MDEKKKILKMVEDGKITAQEALELIEAMGNERKKRRRLKDSYQRERKECSEFGLMQTEQDGRGKSKSQYKYSNKRCKKADLSLTK